LRRFASCSLAYTSRAVRGSTDEAAALERRVKDEIDARGHFHVTGHTGLVTARAPSV
jgi:hypothetical protein